jgi:hypothetical protein
MWPIVAFAADSSTVNRVAGISCPASSIESYGPASAQSVGVPGVSWLNFQAKWHGRTYAIDPIRRLVAAHAERRMSFTDFIATVLPYAFVIASAIFIGRFHKQRRSWPSPVAFW